MKKTTELPFLYSFNVDFARSRGITEPELLAMDAIYVYLFCLLRRPFHQFGTHKEVVDVIQAMEYTLQLFWKFPLTADKHTYWYKVDGCRCGSLDNSDPVYSGLRVINLSCPFHGIEK